MKNRKNFTPILQNSNTQHKFSKTIEPKCHQLHRLLKCGIYQNQFHSKWRLNENYLSNIAVHEHHTRK